MLKVFVKKSRGFTLVELLVVIAIVALLASLAWVSLGSARAKARDAKRQSDLTQIKLAMEMCYNDINCGPGEAKYPIHPADANGTVNAWTQIDNEDGTPIFLNSFPVDPLGAGDFQYKWFASAEQYYCLAIQSEMPALRTFSCVSNRGIASKPYVSPDYPKKDDCCGFDID